MKSGTRTALRVAAWSASSLLVVGAAAGTANAASHAKHKTKHATSSDETTTAPPAGRPNVLHGTATVEKADGSFENYANQTGTVSAISATSITVVSADEYSATYAIDDDTVIVKDGAKAATTDVAQGDTVQVMAEEESDDSFTAEFVADGKPPAPKGGPGHPGGPPPGGPGAPGGAPSNGEGAGS